MKKLMTALATAATALFACGMANALPTGTSAEGGTAGANLVTTAKDVDGDQTDNVYWYMAATDGDNGVVYSNYVGETSVTTPIASRPDMFTNVNNTTYLSLDTTSPLFRSVGSNDGTGAFTGVAADSGDGIYLDTLVKFTAADDVFGDDALSNGVDKIAISYVEQSDEVENPITNFVVRAGRTVGNNFGAFNYTCTVANAQYTFNKEDWHRLTVRTIANVGDGQVGFVIYLDGNMANLLRYDTGVDAGFGTLSPTVANFYNEDLHALFPSAVESGATGGSTISAASFSGTGAIDDIVFTSTKPEFINESVIVPFTADAGVAGISVKVGGGSRCRRYDGSVSCRDASGRHDRLHGDSDARFRQRL